MKKCFKPLSIFVYEKAYLLWVVLVLIVLAANLIVTKATEFFLCGQSLVFLIALLVPFLLDFLLPFIVNKKSKKDTEFTTFKIIGSLIDIILIIVSFLLISSANGQNSTFNSIFQITIFVIGMLFVVYFYAISKLDVHSNFFSEIIDRTYGDAEKASVEELKKQAKDINDIGGVKV